MNTSPYEVVNPLYTLYWAAVGAAPPLPWETPGEGYTKIGTGGTLNYGEEGVQIELPQSVNPFRSLGSAAVRKNFRDTEDVKVRITLVDMTIEQWHLAFNRNTITPTAAAGAGTYAYKSIGGSRGFELDTLQLILRANVTPYAAEGFSQYIFWRAQQTGSPSKVSVRGTPVGIQLEWSILVDETQENDEENLWKYQATTGSVAT
jgi:hypothetical protein